MKRTVENIRDPLFRFFEREVNAGIQMLADVRRDIEDAILICLGEKKQTNHHRILLASLAKSQFIVTRHLLPQLSHLSFGSCTIGLSISWLDSLEAPKAGFCFVTL